jgi:hypothetical protein
MQEICETIVKIKSLKSVSGDNSPVKPNGHYNSEGFISELQLYQPIKLHGTLLMH